MRTKTIKAIIFDWKGTLYERGELLREHLQILQELREKYRLGLIAFSKNLGDFGKREEEIKKAKVASLFDIIIITEEKTEELYSRCIDELGARSEETAIVDDGTKGIEIGNSLGCKTFWINGKYSGLPSKEIKEPTYRINSVKELINFL